MCVPSVISVSYFLSVIFFCCLNFDVRLRTLNLAFAVVVNTETNTMPAMCFVCEKTFSNQSNLNKHIKKVHNLKPKIKIVSYDQSKCMYKCLENNCNSSFRHNVGLNNHLTVKHNKMIESEEMEFSNKEEFLAWKTSTEKINQSNYVLSSSSKFKDKAVKYYLCNRSGKVRTRGLNKRLPKSQGSCKLNRCCTSMIKVIDGEKLLVTWIKTHYGHMPDLQHIRISQIDKSIVASKLTLGVPPARILDSYRDQINKEDLNRQDLITRKDIQNIKKSYHINISEGVKHDVDSISVDLWVKQCKQEENNCVLFYKQQGVEDDIYKLYIVDFCLIVMTDFQKNIIKKFGNNIVALDGTHGLNNYDFELTTVMVVDEFGEGVPVAFMFTNRKDTYIYKLFFDVIKLNVGLVSPKVFMTDIVSTFYSAWCSTMGPANQQLFCSWHIDRAWQQNLSKISNREKRSEVYKVIKCLQQNTSVDVFPECLQNSMSEMLLDVETHDFGVYFQNNYCKNYEKWAYCFRAHCGINTNMRLESMHKTIKYFYLDGKKVKRLDKSLHVLLKYVRDKCVDRIIKNIKGKHTIHTKNILLRHRAAQLCNFLIDFDKDNKFRCLISTVTDNEETGEIYCVEKLLKESCCDLMCNDCQICYHTYSCTCHDFCIGNSICKHIHYIEMSYHKENKMLEPERMVFEGSEWNISEKNVNKSDTLKQNFSARILSTVTKLQNTDKSILDDEVILKIQSHLDIIDKLLDLPSVSNESFIPVNCNEPTNKKIKKQNRFFSTQKKRKVKKSQCKKPTISETVEIKKDLKSNFRQLYISTNSSIDHNYLS